ncbi:hypothetical protein E3P81_03879 [Wallemia ichthyophaga]|nr:hypothetical protein E3P97_03880 [Wallemia ichthyophaga]TIB28114.1 hypothetical protein E3P85_03845 [Wallemia ichthyophaga]TIB43680.1 hypothetical protein E3P82_03885 [Wallemia ichthyophaga]TIB45901.1 hypothetical protein E3P81_03879 [Wallemia ichthyophaga]TIB48127.1 hypothetical protein E3P80_03889 [Wallemia ichthyophaga]
MTQLFQSLFPPLDVSNLPLSQARRLLLLSYNASTRTIDMRHYEITVKPYGVSKRVRRVVPGASTANKLPNLSNVQDISQYILNQDNSGYESAATSDSEVESEVDETGQPVRVVQLAEDFVGRGNKKDEKRAIKLKEIGPRMELSLVKITTGLAGSQPKKHGLGGNNEGEVLFHEYINKSKREVKDLAKKHTERKAEVARRRKEQEANVERKRKDKEDRKAKGEQVEEEDEVDEEEVDDEFGEMGDPEEDLENLDFDEPSEEEEENETKEEWDDDFEFDKKSIRINENTKNSEWDEDIQKSDYTQSTLFDSNSTKSNSLKSLIENNQPPTKHSSLTPPPTYTHKHTRLRRNSLSDLRIPQRVKAAQQGLRVQLGSVREFAKGVDELRQLSNTLESIKNKIPWPSIEIPAQLKDECTSLDSIYSNSWDSANVLIQLASGSGVVPIDNNDNNNSDLPRSLSTSPAHLNSFSDHHNNRTHSHKAGDSLNDRQLDILKTMLQSSPSKNLDTNTKTKTNSDSPPSTPLTRKTHPSKLRRASRAGLNSFKDFFKQFVGSGSDSMETPTPSPTPTPTTAQKSTKDTRREQREQNIRVSQENLAFPSTPPEETDTPIQIPQKMHRKRPSIAQLFTRKASSVSLQRKPSFDSTRPSVTLRENTIPQREGETGEADAANTRDKKNLPKEQVTPLQTPTKPKRLTHELRSYSENLSTPKARISSYREKEIEREKENAKMISTPTHNHIENDQSDQSDDCKLQLTPDALPQLLGHLRNVKAICQESLDQWINIPTAK